jgi:hypothetical protein
MLEEFPVTITIDKIDKEEFCLKLELRLEDGELVNAIGHDGTIQLVNKLCGTNFEKNRVNIKMKKGDLALVISVNQRLEEGKVLNAEEMMKLMLEGKISFYEVML